MTLTIVLSGPKAAEQQARTALAAAGFTVEPGGHDHGLPERASGKKVRQAVSFLTVRAEDVDAVASCAASLKYVLRLHHETPEEPEPSLEHRLIEELAALRAEVNELKARAA
jgi:hypothetical protein